MTPVTSIRAILRYRASLRSEVIKRRIILAHALYAIAAILCVISAYWRIGFIVPVQLNFAVAPRVPLLSRF